MHPRSLGTDDAAGRRAGGRCGAWRPPEPRAGHRAGVAGNVAGSYVAWAVGRYGGQTAWRRLTRFVAGSDDGMARAQRWFDRNGARSVFIGRLLPVIRTFISLPAGFARMSPVRFGLYTVAGCVPWIGGLAWAGWAAGANWHRVTGLVQEAGYVVGGLAVVLVAVAIIVVVRARRRHRRAAADVATGVGIGDHSDLERRAPARQRTDRGIGRRARHARHGRVAKMSNEHSPARFGGRITALAEIPASWPSELR